MISNTPTNWTNQQIGKNGYIPRIQSFKTESWINRKKMGSVKDRKGMDLTEEEDIKRWQEYTEELYEKDLHNPDNHNGVITYLESDILECEISGS